MILTELISSINLAFSRSKKLSFGVVSSYTAIECRASDMAKLPSYHGEDQEGRRSWNMISNATRRIPTELQTVRQDLI